MEEEFGDDEDDRILETEEVFVEEDGLESPHSDSSQTAQATSSSPYSSSPSPAS